MEYKRHANKTKEEKLKEKWDRKGQPRPLDEEAQMKQYLEQEALAFGGSLQKRGALVFLPFMRLNDVELLFRLCEQELISRLPPMPEIAPEAVPRVGLLDEFGKAAV
jgi:hypothetical protein